MCALRTPSSFTTLVLPDNAQIAFQVLGEQVGRATRQTPIFLVGGLSSTRGDWDRLASSLSRDRPVIIYDHRGIGDSKFPPNANGPPELSLEMMAQDLIYLIHFLNYDEVAICGFSLGGVIVQQLLFLPYHPERPERLNFRVSHVFLAATMTSPLKEKGYGVTILRNPPSGRNTSREDIREWLRPSVSRHFDPKWIAENKDRFNLWLDMMAEGRPPKTLLLQAKAAKVFDFSPYYSRLSRDIKIMVIHGKLDQILPFSGIQEIVSRIPWAKVVEEGLQPGQIPHTMFGHNWPEYFDVHVWHDVFQKFLSDSKGLAKL